MQSEGHIVECQQLHTNLYQVTCLLLKAHSFHAGQYVSCFEDIECTKKIGTYSYGSIPSDLPYVHFYLRHPLPVSLTQKIYFSKPSGTMIAAEEKTYIFCAGGTGVTPFLSLMKQYPERKFQLYWSIVHDRDLTCLPAGFDISNSHVFQYQDTDSDLFQALSLINKERDPHLHVYLAGPIAFIDTVANFLLTHGIIQDFSQLSSDLRKFS